MTQKSNFYVELYVLLNRLKLPTYFEKLFSGEGITQFFHDHPDKQEIPNCDGKDCYNLTLVYDNTPQQIASIVERSRSCKQKFEVSGNF